MLWQLNWANAVTARGDWNTPLVDAVALASVISSAAVGLTGAGVAFYSAHRTAKTAREGRAEQRAADGYLKVLAVAEVGGELELLVQTTADLVGCPACGAVARAKDRRPTWVRDLPISGRPVVLCWWKRVWCCPHRLCQARTWTEQHEAIAPRAGLTERARAWAFERVPPTGPSPGSRRRWGCRGGR
jgi:hypothetical protein